MSNSFTQVFGGTTIYPADVSYLALTLDGNISLEWPLEATAGSTVVARIIDITPSGAYTITMPDATSVSVGQTVLFNNLGPSTVAVNKANGSAILSIGAGEQWQAYLIDNTTVGGTWRTLRYGAATAQAQAAALAGPGLTTSGSALAQNYEVIDFTVTPYVSSTADRAKVFVWKGGLGTLNLPTAAAAGDGWFVQVRNGGQGDLTIDPSGSELINAGSTLRLQPGDSAVVVGDGVQWYTIGFGQQAVFAFDYTSVAVTGGTYTLSGSELNRIAYKFTGTLTSNATIVVPATVQQYWVNNATTGPFTLSLRAAGSGTSTPITQASTAILYCDGTAIVPATTAVTFAGILPVLQGGTGANNPSSARTNLGASGIGSDLFTALTTASARNTILAASSGANSDITSLTGLTTPITVAQGGTGTATALTSGSVVFSGASGVYSQDNANFFWDNTNNRLGVGTATPSYPLEARTDAASGFNYIGSVNTTATGAFGAGFLARAGSGFSYFYMRGDGLAYLENATANPLAFATNGEERMRITSAGDVGIGTTAPAERFQVNVGTGASGFEKGISLTNGVDANLFNYVTGTAATDKRAFITAGAVNQSLSFGTLYTERMRITSAGDVGIGTTSIGSRLTIGDPGTGLGFTNAASGNFNLGLLAGTGSAAAYVYQRANDVLLLGTNNIERMRITAAGDVGIGTTPTGKLDVNGNIRTTVGSGGTLALYETDATRANQFVMGADAFGSYLTASFATGGSAVLRFNTSSDERMRINSLGNVGIGTNSPGARLEVFNNDTNLRLNTALVGGNVVDINPFVTGVSNSGFSITVGGNIRQMIDASGNVGIGTTSPSARLDVNGTLRANSLTLTTALPVTQGGTGATDAGTARSNLSAAATGAVTTSGITMSTARMLGRTTASTGAIEEITIGSGLSLSGGTLSSTAGGGTVTSVSGTGTVNGITLTGSFSTSGSLTLGGALSGVSLTTQVSGTLPIANGGTGGTSQATAQSALNVPSATGAGASGNWGINITGNAATATDGVVTTASYTDPSWISSLAGSKISGNITGNAANVTGTVAVANGGTGQTTYTNGQLLIGNTTGNTLTKATLTAGSGISITNGSGSITIAATAGGGSVTSVDASGGTTGLSFSGGPIITSGTLTLGGTLAVANGGTGAADAGTARTNLSVPSTTGGGASGTWGISITGNAATATNGVVTTGSYADPAWITSLAGSKISGTVAVANGGTGGTSQATAQSSLDVPSRAGSGASGTWGISITGNAATATNGVVTTGSYADPTWITSLSASKIAGILAVDKGGTGQSSYTNGQLLIGNTSTGGLTKATLTAGSGISITNGGGSITIASSAAGTVTSVSGSGGTTGLTLSGGPIIDSGTLTLGGTLAVANGGTGAIDAGTARTNLSVPSTTGGGASGTWGISITGNAATATNGIVSTSSYSDPTWITSLAASKLTGNITGNAVTIDSVTIGFRSIPRSTTSGTAVVGDVGRCIAVTAGITIPNATFAAGDAVSIYNNSASAVTITQGASLTLRQAGTTNTGNRTLDARGMATIWFNSSSEAIISGAGVS